MKIGGGPVQAAAFSHTMLWVASQSSQAPFLNPLLASKTPGSFRTLGPRQAAPSCGDSGDPGPRELVPCPVCLCSDTPSHVLLEEFQLSHP